jgi:hypothetical protein
MFQDFFEIYFYEILLILAEDCFPEILICHYFSCCFAVRLVTSDNDIGYIKGVKRLEYPKELHDSHNDYTFFPIHKESRCTPYE